jgi:MoaA/NifB/PqqE/SkfB family radical SAM enzyme
VVITNGYFLLEKIKELSKFVDCFIVSIDYPSEKHDEMRHCKGIFNKAIQGIEIIKGKFPYIKIIINSVVSKLNKDKIKELADLSKELNVPIYFCPMETGEMTSKGFNNRKGHLALNQDEISSFAYEVISLKKQGYKINNSYNYLDTFVGGKRNFKCNIRKFAAMVYPNGDIIDCIKKDEPVENLRNVSLKNLFNMERIKNLRFSEVNCSVCNNPDIIDASYIWDLKLESLWSYIKLNYI